MIGKILLWLQEHIKHWTKPATSVLIIGLLSDLTRSHADLVVENALLRQQLIVLKRQVKRPQLSNLDRFRDAHLFVSRLQRPRVNSNNRSSSCEDGSYLVTCARSILRKTINQRISVCIQKINEPTLDGKG